MRKLRSVLLPILTRTTYYTGIDALFYWLNRRAKRAVTFHDVLSDDIYSLDQVNSCACSVTDFRKMVRNMREHFEFSADIKDPSTLTITFDDGLSNQYEVAAKILQEEGNIPAIIFVVGSAIDVKNPKDLFPTELLMQWCESVPWKVVISNFGDISNRVELWQKIIQPNYLKDAANRGYNYVQVLDGIFPFSEIYKKVDQKALYARYRGISREQLADLRKRGWIIGWHTKTHFPLAGLDRDQKKDELTSPPDMLCTIMSYPYGDLDRVDHEAIKIAEELGYDVAFSNWPYHSNRHCNFFYPRFLPCIDRYESHFVLSGLKYFLQSGRLLPVVKE